MPSEKVIADMVTLINRMMKTFCAISKLEYLLEVVRLTYENIRDVKQPKKSMNDLGADGEEGGGGGGGRERSVLG